MLTSGGCMVIIVRGERDSIADRQRRRNTPKRQQQTANYGTQPLHSLAAKDSALRPRYFQEPFFGNGRTSIVAPTSIKAILNHCASLKPNPIGGFMRQNSTVKRDKPAKIR